MNDITKTKIPFLGLKPYGTDNAHHFYGRDHAVEDVLSILQKNKFLCLTGSLGSGKSSLINAGLIPRLLNGFNGIAGDQWSICSFRPSDSPLENFAQALSYDHVLSLDNKPNTSDYLYYLDQIKEKGTGALRSIYTNSELAGQRNLLVVIDQIEDLFHITEKLNYTTSTDDDLLFDIVNKTVRFKDVAIYFVLITTTSYLTNLSQYSGLQELISKTQYAMQSLTLNAVAQILSNGFKDILISWSPSLVEQIHEELKEDNSLLPSFQLLLFNLYHEYKDNEAPKTLQLADVPENIRLKTYVNQQFTDFYEGLDVGQQGKLALIFSTFYTLGNANSKSYITSIAQIKNSTGLNDQAFYEWYLMIKEHLQEFMQVVPSLITQTKTDADFSNWLGSDLVHLNYTTFFDPAIFKGWMHAEGLAYWRYEEYAQILKQHKKGETGLLVSPQLDLAVAWMNNELVNASWASKYDLPFNEVIDLIVKSDEQQRSLIHASELKREKESRKERFQKRLYLAFAVVSVLLMLFAAFKWRDADAAKKVANAEKEMAQELMKENQIISRLIKIKSKAPSMLVRLQNVGEKNDKNYLLNQVQELIKTELLFDSLNRVYNTSYVTDDWMHDLNVTALSLLEGKKGYTETSMLIDDLETYPVLDFSVYNDEKVAFVGRRNKLSINYLDRSRAPLIINHDEFFEGQMIRVLFTSINELLVLTDRQELFLMSLTDQDITLVHKASDQNPIKDFIYDPLEQVIIIVKDSQFIVKRPLGSEKTIDQDGNRVQTHFYNNKLYAASSKGIFVVNSELTMDPLELVHDSNPDFTGLTSFHIKSGYVFVGFENGTVKMYQIDQAELFLKHIFSLDEHSGKITSMYYNAIEHVLYTAGLDNRIFRYNLKIQDDEVDEDFSELKGHESTVWKIDGFKNNKGQEILLTADQQGHLLSWYIDDIDMVRELKYLVDNELTNK